MGSADGVWSRSLLDELGSYLIVNEIDQVGIGSKDFYCTAFIDHCP